MILEMLKNIKFNQYISKFQRRMKMDIKNILENNKTIVFADKTMILYKTNPKFYKTLVTDSITKPYKTSNDDLAKI